MGIIADAQDGLKARLQTISGLNVYEQGETVSREPSALIEFDPETYDPNLAIGGTSVQAEFAVTVRVKHSRLVDAWDGLFDVVSPTGAKSIEAAIAEDRTLGGNVDDAHMVGAGEFGVDPEYPSLARGVVRVQWVKKNG